MRNLVGCGLASAVALAGLGGCAARTDESRNDPAMSQATESLTSSFEGVTVNGEVKRDGSVHRIVFAGGDVEQKLKVVGKAPARASGTIVRTWPDPK